jgi:hypothetical protein
MCSEKSNTTGLISQLFPAIDGSVVKVAILVVVLFARCHGFESKHVMKIDFENVNIADPATAIVNGYDCFYYMSVIVYHARIFSGERDIPVGERQVQQCLPNIIFAFKIIQLV